MKKKMGINNKIFITSLNKAVNLSKVYGKLNLQLPYLLYTLNYYIEFTEGKLIYNKLNKQLKLFVSKLKNKYPEELCNYKIRVTNKTLGREAVNTPPTVDDTIIDLEGEFTYQFNIEDFINNFSDAENDSYSTIIIYPGSISNLYFNGEQLTNIIEINNNEISNLSYIYPQEDSNVNYEEVDDSFKFKIADDNVNKLYSSYTNINIINSNYLSNLPPEIGTIVKNVENRVTTYLTLDVFTNQMQPPYSDPENDDIDAIRIDSIYEGNQGEFLYNDVPVVPGQIITANDLENDLFKHIGPNQDSSNSDMITFSARDTGSLIWVQ